MADIESSNLRRLPATGKGSRPRLNPGFQDPGPRGRFLVEKYGPGQIQNWYKMILADRADEIPLSTSDTLLLGRIARGLRDDVALERFYDRAVGKVPDKVINLNLNVDVDPAKLSQDAADMLDRLEDD